MLVVAGVVNKSFNQFAKENDIKTESGSFVVKGGTIDLFTSNDDDEPANTAAMAKDQSSPLGLGTHPINTIVKWVAFEVVSGSPVVEETFAIGR